MSDKIRVLLDEEKVDARIREIGEQISKDYAGRSVHLVCVLKGGTFFMCELAKRIRIRKIPDLTFIVDDTLDKADRIEEILKK